MSLTTTTSLLTTTANATSLNVTLSLYVRPFDEPGIVESVAIIFTFLVVGLFGNILTIIVISTNSKLNDIFMQFILSLCVSDLISALISWMNLYRRTWGFETWNPLPDFLCRFYWAADVMTNYVTALHILSSPPSGSFRFSIRSSLKNLSVQNAKIWIAVIWIVSFLCGFIPISIMFGTTVPDRYSNEPHSKWPACTLDYRWYPPYIIYQKLFFSLCLYLPTVGVVLLCVLIAVNVRSRHRQSSSSRTEQVRRRKERQAVLQLALIVLSFLIGYIPYTAHEFWTMLPRENTQYNRIFDYWFGTFRYFCLRFSECLNPVFYNLGSRRMRSCTAALLRKTFCCSVKNKAVQSSSRKSVAISSNTNNLDV